MGQVFPTKSNLINTKKSLELAKLGYDLMDRKRNILIRELMLLVEKAKQVQSDIGDVYEKAYTALKKANIAMGDCNMFAEAVSIKDDIDISYKSVMGVEIPVIEYIDRNVDIRSFGFNGTNRNFDEACKLFREVKRLTAELAETESSVCRLADAVAKTQKRSNALSNIMIPKLEETVKYISGDLDEKEREEFSRLKVIKKIKDK